jgi:ADP-ribose pyrophosphatase YjhB (NUDIX family)
MREKMDRNDKEEWIFKKEKDKERDSDSGPPAKKRKFFYGKSFSGKSGKPHGEMTIVANVAVECGDEVLLIKRKDNNLWECPGGRVEFGEPMIVAAARELFEETGIRTETGKLAFACFVESIDTRKSMHYVFIYFRLRLKDRPYRIDLTEHVEHKWFAKGELPEDRMGANKRALSIVFGKRE